jgi:hypothetical protein
MSGVRAAILLLLISAAAPARAQQPATESDDLFNKGRQAMREQDYARALTLFERSESIEPAVGTLLNLAICEEKLGRLLRARDHLHEALDAAGPSDRRRGLIAERFSEIDDELPRLTITGPAALAPGVVVRLDGEPLDRSHLLAPIPLDPGVHTLRCSGSLARPCDHTFTIAPREQIAQLVEGVPAPSRATATSPTVALGVAETVDRPAPRRAGTLPHVLEGIGAVGLGVGIGSGAAALYEKAQVAQHCDRARCDSEGTSDIRMESRLSIVAATSLAIGLVGLATAAYLSLRP